MENKNKQDFRTIRGYQLADKQKNRVTSAMEDYLEMIRRLSEGSGYVRVGKLSEHLHVKPSSASKMVGKLMNLGYLEYDNNESITLTESGKQLSAYLLKRHNVIEQFLTFLGHENPLQETEMMEHSISSYTVLMLEGFIDFFANDNELKKKFDDFLKNHIDS